MPSFHRYRNRSGYYVRASRDGINLTYQLTTKGASILLAAGLAPGQFFSWVLLDALSKQGEAYTFVGRPRRPRRRPKQGGEENDQMSLL